MVNWLVVISGLFVLRSQVSYYFPREGRQVWRYTTVGFAATMIATLANALLVTNPDAPSLMALALITSAILCAFDTTLVVHGAIEWWGRTLDSASRRRNNYEEI